MRKNYKLKRKIAFSTLLIILFLCLVGIGEAATIKLRITVEKANIRLKPTTESVVIFQAPLGAILNAEEKIGEWYRVNLPPDERGVVVSGYIHQSIVEVLEEIKEVPKEEIIEEKKSSELKEEKEVESEQIPQVPRREPTKRYSFRAGLGLSFPSGDWADLFNLGLGLSAGNGFSIVRQQMFDIELLGSIEAHMFFRKSEYSEINWTRLILSGDGRFNFKVDPITIFVQGGLGLYLDSLEISVWWWKEEGTELRFGPRIGGGIACRDLEIIAMYHLVENNMFTVMGSVIYRF